MANNYNILAKHIVSRYSRRISGSDIDEYLIGEGYTIAGYIYPDFS